MSTGVYIHVPFCKRKCLYCDFVSCSKDNHSEYFDFLLKEADMYKNILSVESIDSIFIGGGTPSYVDGKYISGILEKFNPETDAEITIEANPGTLTKEKLKIYKNAGINRISIGLQSANDDELKALGRIHTFDEFLNSYEMATATGFSNINIDLMFGIPNQTLVSFSKTLDEVYKLNPTHISCYSLIIEEGTPFYNMELSLPSEEEEREMYKLICENEKGYERYEISNFAKKGYECKHNIKYWTFQDFIGLGLNAYSFYKGKRYSNYDSFESYFNAINNNRLPISFEENETEEELVKDYIITAMRMSKGISYEDFKKRFSFDFYEAYKNIIEKFISSGHIIKTDNGIAFSDKGFEVSNSILTEFL